METGDSTSAKPESKDPFLSLPSDIIAKIIGYTTIAQWPSLELLDKNFRAATLIAWRQLRNVSVDRDFMIQPESEEDGSLRGKVLQELVDRSPFLKSLNGIAELNLESTQLLVQFEHLQSITLGVDDDPQFFTSEHGIQLELVTEFLDTTRSRSSLTELRLYGIIQRQYSEWGRDQFAASFVTGHELEYSPNALEYNRGREIPSPLKLEKFSFSSGCYLPSIRLDTVDTTRLTDVRVGKASSIEPQQLTDLIERAPNLLRIELEFSGCPEDNCDGPHLQANKKLLMALSSHENLAAVKLGGIGFHADRCVYFGHDFIEMLKSIGRRGNIRKLAITDNYVSSETNVDEICSTIHDYIPYLQSIKLSFNDMSIGSIRNIVGLTELEEMYIVGFFTRMTPNVIKEIAQLPRLKRLAINNDYDFDYADEEINFLGSLADATSLTHLRIRHAYWISADVFEKWADGFASNLQILMLSIGDNHAEEGLVRLLERANRLRVLILDGRVTDQSLTTIANSCPELEILGVRSTSNGIADGHRMEPQIVQRLQQIVDRCPKLKRFGGFDDKDRMMLQFPKYRKIGDVDMDNEWDVRFRQ